MPKTALKHMAKKAGVSLGRAEHLWDKAGEIVSSEYDEDKDSPSYWALRMGITKRMLGLSENEKITFKMFFEEATAQEPKYEKLSIENAIALLNKHCKDSLWMLELNSPIWRGDMKVKFPKSGFLTVNTARTERRSQNTSNYYTVIFDNHPEMKDFPKRSRSFIANTSKDRALDYTVLDNPFVIIPFDGAKVGFTHRYDIWDIHITAFGINRDLEAWNSLFDILNIRDDIESFIKFDNALKRDDPKALEELRMIIEAYGSDIDGTDIKKYSKGFLKEIFRAYSPKETGFEWKHPADMKQTFLKRDVEVWVEGNVVLISEPMWKKLLMAF